MKFAKDNFICVAADDVAYSHGSDELKQKKEYKFLRDAMSKAPHGIHQGIYVITPSGKFLGRIQDGWPVPDPVKSLVRLKKAKSDFDSLAKNERTSSLKLTANDRAMWKPSEVKAPVGTLQLHNVSRGYKFVGMEDFDVRTPHHFALDSLWLSSDEARTMVPSDLSVGSKSKVGKEVTMRMLVHNHLQQGCAAWWHEHVKKADFTVEVVKRERSLVHLQYKGAFDMKGDSKWQKDGYKGTMLGKAVWNADKRKFESIELVSLGKSTLHELRGNMHRGDTKTTTNASILIMNDKMKGTFPPHKLDEYPRGWK